MNYPPQPAIDTADRSAAHPVDYAWDDWEPYSLLGDDDLCMQTLLRSVTDRAKLAFAIACAEWVVTRLDPWLEGDITPWKFIEACWAFEMSDRFALPAESDESEWKGKVRAPVDLALMTILNTAIGFEDDNAEVDAAFAAQIALHVLVERGAFLRWRRLVLHRLRRMYPKTQDATAGDERGVPVPREVLMFPMSIEPQKADSAVEAFMAAVNVHSNPFVIEATIDPDIGRADESEHWS